MITQATRKLTAYLEMVRYLRRCSPGSAAEFSARLDGRERIKLGRGLRIAKGAVLSAGAGGSLTIGDNVSIARDYLGCEPILDTFHIWASPVFGKAPSSEAAQLFHYDMAHPRFVKFFIYLTDVTPMSGPHCVISSSHRRDLAGWQLRFNSKRISDAAIEKAYPARSRELTGAKGTLIVEDTRAFHKGKHLTEGCRFILEAYFVNAVVGDRIPAPELTRRELGEVSST